MLRIVTEMLQILKNHNIAIFFVFRLDNGMSVWYNVHGGYKSDACGAHHTSKQKEGFSMFDYTSKNSNHFREKARIREEEKSAKIAQDLTDAGILENPAQRSVSTENKIRQIMARYQDELRAEMLKGSTGYKGKFADVANRVLMAMNNGRAIPLHWFACRTAGKVDIFVTGEDGKRYAVEIKTGAGELARADTLEEAHRAIADACDANKLIVWYPFIDEFDALAPDALDEFDSTFHLFMPVGQLFDLLKEYNGNIDTWLREPNENTVNFQNLRSEKKRKFLRKLAAESYDWPTFRDYGKVVKQ